MTRTVEAVLFDKDGTLFDFAATWNVWAGRVIGKLSHGDPEQAARLAAATRYDLARQSFHADSLIISGTNRQAAECLGSVLTDWPVAEIEEFLIVEASSAPLVEPAPLVPLLATLSAMDLSLGVMTNDAEEVARAHLQAAGVLRVFDFIAGFDSGFGAKPDPAPLLAFARLTGHAPGRVAMVGDSVHDLQAGRAAGMWCVGVLTGMAGADVLAPWADVVLPDISYLPDWLNGLG